MAKEKTAKELSEIMSTQLDVLTSGTADIEDIRLADAVANQIGKLIKLAALEQKEQIRKKESVDIPALTRQ